MSRLFFPIQQVRELIAHIRRCDKHFKPYGRKAEPAIVFVKDDGIYIMSSGLVEGEKRFVVYAEGFDPNVVSPEYLWDLCCQAAGGDDFSEAIPLDPMLEKSLEDPLATRLYIDLTETQIGLGIEALPFPVKYLDCPMCKSKVAIKPRPGKDAHGRPVPFYSEIPVLCPYCRQGVVRVSEKKPRSRKKAPLRTSP
jgi:hypothetical protein